MGEQEKESDLKIELEVPEHKVEIPEQDTMIDLQTDLDETLKSMKRSSGT